MNVELLYHTENPERAIATAARLCYAPVGAAELMETMPDQTVQNVLKVIMTGGHFSTLEHASFTFAIDGVSRALTHQLVRHRLASFNQQSQRYVKLDNPELVIPESIRNSSFFAEAQSSMRYMLNLYERMVEAGIPAEDARYVTPQAVPTSLIVTMNVRELRHFFSLRCCNRAQWEIRQLADEMLKLCRKAAPTLFENAGPGCVRGGCPEKRSCGHPRSKAEWDR